MTVGVKVTKTQVYTIINSHLNILIQNNNAMLTSHKAETLSPLALKHQK